MQPYFFTYIGYFQLIANTNLFIFFDIVQYNKKSWMNRNRMLHPSKSDDFKFISVPISKISKGSPIKDIEIGHDGVRCDDMLMYVVVIWFHVSAAPRDLILFDFQNMFSGNNLDQFGPSWSFLMNEGVFY